LIDMPPVQPQVNVYPALPLITSNKSIFTPYQTTWEIDLSRLFDRFGACLQSALT
jgi:hypothetical protein